MQKKFILIFPGILLLGSLVFIASKKISVPRKTHYHAGFVVFENNKKIDFSDNKYMYIKPCTANGKDQDKNENVQMEKAHLHDNVGDVVHIEHTGATWKDLFINIGYPIDYTKTTGFINGNRAENYQSYPIGPNDTLAVFTGTNDIKIDLKQVPLKDYIETVGRKSKICGE